MTLMLMTVVNSVANRPIIKRLKHDRGSNNNRSIIESESRRIRIGFNNIKRYFRAERKTTESQNDYIEKGSRTKQYMKYWNILADLSRRPMRILLVLGWGNVLLVAGLPPGRRRHL